MKEKIVLFSVFAFMIWALASPLPMNAEEEASAYLTVQIENRPALDVPYVPTPQEVVDQMLSIAGVNGKDVLYDLGCGDGRIVVTAAKERNVPRAVGIDIDPQRIRESNENARRAGVSERVAFFEKNLFDIDFREATVMTLYLLPSVNLKLRPKLLQDLKPGARIVSHDFDMGEWKPDKQTSVLGHTIYFWIVPANVNGAWSWSIMEDGQAHRYELNLAQRFQTVDSAELKVDGAQRAVKNVRISGDQLEFTMEWVKGGRKQRQVFRGSVKGPSVNGFMSPSGTGEKTKWSARLVPNTAKPIDVPADAVISL